MLWFLQVQVHVHNVIPQTIHNSNQTIFLNRSKKGDKGVSILRCCVSKTFNPLHYTACPVQALILQGCYSSNNSSFKFSSINQRKVTKGWPSKGWAYYAVSPTRLYIPNRRRLISIWNLCATRMLAERQGDRERTEVGKASFKLFQNQPHLKIHPNSLT